MGLDDRASVLGLHGDDEVGLRELAHLVAATTPDEPAAYPTAYPEGDPATRLRELTRMASQARSRRLVPPCPEPDIADPYGRGAAAYAHAYAQICAAVDTLLHLVLLEPRR